MPKFLVETDESVRGEYWVEADSEEDARDMFGDPRIHPDAEQTEYMVYSVEVRSVSEQVGERSE